jgi:hypothetical protein
MQKQHQEAAASPPDPARIGQGRPVTDSDLAGRYETDLAYEQDRALAGRAGTEALEGGAWRERSAMAIPSRSKLALPPLAVAWERKGWIWRGGRGE